MNENKTDVFDFDGIRMLVELMKENNVSELDLEHGEQRLKLRRAVASVPASAPVVERVVAPVAPEPKAAPAQAADDSAFIKTIDSPMVGTFYLTPNPEARPLVKVGDVVNPSQTVCIIEAMKVFNDIQAEISGKIVAILVENGAAVEFGAPLFKVDVRG